MDQELANKLFEIGAFILFLDAPPNLEFGIDYNAWIIGPLFKGVKMIPPGLHFIYFSSTSKEGVQGIRTGFFHFFESKEILVRVWNPQTEDLRDETEIDPAQAERYRINIREFDRNMGPYPLDPPLYYERWKKLTNFITPGLVRRVLPNNGKVSHLPEKNANLTIDESNVKDKRLGRQIEKEEGMEFTPFDLRKSFPTGASGDEITRWSLDKSWLVKDLLKRVYHNDYRIMLGELQLAFVCLLMAQNFSGFNQWKQLVQLLCSCQQLMEDNPDLFIDFMDVLQFQLDECPEDFFRDILSENNFTSVMLKSFQQNVPSSQPKLIDRYSKLKKFIIKKFDWNVPDDDEDDDDDAPVVVNTE
ncbi:a1-alpha2 repression [Rhizopus azygosporus]|uniref:A1-alpha2 repression n=1 Tax=Rhizopus azygosporus TaxID=86630 RepID=A0A367JMU4_RHIAZ|nr:a1-alpha2 repression [Rhizopus azygosporus]